MPEGPEVAITADQLQWCVGTTITNMIATSPHSTGWTQVDAFMMAVNRTITRITTRGKKLIFVLQGAGGNTIMMVSSLGMTGRWSWLTPAHPEHCLFTITVTNGASTATLYYTDDRRIGSLEWCFNDNDWQALLARVGPAHLIYPITGQSEYTPEYWLQVVRKHPKLSVGKFINEQKYFSGVGNYLRSEILYHTGVSPHRLLADMTDAEVELMRVNTVNIMMHAYQCSGKTLSDFISPNGQGGRMVTSVYPNNVRAPQSHCPRGGVIVREMLKGQQVHWVPALQR